jgi:phosphocarrier protein
MKVMTACIKQGAEIELECSGPDEEQMLAAAVALIKSGLGDEI